MGRVGNYKVGIPCTLHGHLKDKLPNNVPAAWLAFQQFPIYFSPQIHLYSGSAGQAKQVRCVHMCVHVCEREDFLKGESMTLIEP